jgi:tetratricopeptide (TPR) repeat protein
MEVLRRHAARTGRPWPILPAVYYRIQQGRPGEVSAEVRGALPGVTPAMAAAHPDWIPQLRFFLFLSLFAGGRFAEAVPLMLEDLELEGADDAKRSSWRMATAIGRGSSDGLREALDDLERIGGASPAVLDFMAATGDVERAARLARLVRQGPEWDALTRVHQRQVEGILAWARGAPDEAEDGLRARAEAGDLFDRYVGHAYLGAFYGQQRRCREAVAALEVARQLPYPSAQNTRIVTYPSLLEALAYCYEQLGDIALARERNDELLRIWDGADPDTPRLVRAKALKARLEAR